MIEDVNNKHGHWVSTALYHWHLATLASYGSVRNNIRCSVRSLRRAKVRARREHLVCVQWYCDWPLYAIVAERKTYII